MPTFVHLKYKVVNVYKIKSCLLFLIKSIKYNMLGMYFKPNHTSLSCKLSSHHESAGNHFFSTGNFQTLQIPAAVKPKSSYGCFVFVLSCSNQAKATYIHTYYNVNSLTSKHICYVNFLTSFAKPYKKQAKPQNSNKLFISQENSPKAKIIQKIKRYLDDRNFLFMYEMKNLPHSSIAMVK